MNRQRFNILLQDPSKVDNNDIRQLNEYRKKYPYFQSLYVVLSKALKDREHPKTDAFIKKAAIYTANRAHLKEIIEGDVFKNSPTTGQAEEAKTQTPEVKNTPLPQESTKEEQKSVEETTPVKSLDQANRPMSQKGPESKSSEDDQATKNTRIDSDKGTLSYQPDLHELAATKSRIEALLRGETKQPEEKQKHLEPEAKTDDAHQAEIRTDKDKAKKKPLKANQIEIIEKFIADEPRIDIKRKAAAESEQDQEDLAEKQLKSQENFVTETMATLYLKQGKSKKAIHIYEKLCLKFPEKKAYFASQIEKVKSKHNV